jgi:hypothetical protein
MYFIEGSNVNRGQKYFSGGQKYSSGGQNTLSRSHILLGVRNTLSGCLKYFSGGQILIGITFL